MSEVAFPNLTLAENLFKSLIWDNAITAAKTFLFTNPATSFLNVWPLRPIVEYIIDKFTEVAFTAIRLMVDVTAIRLVNLEHQREYDDASVKLMRLADQFGPDSDAFKTAREDAKKALSKFARFGAST